MNLLLSQIREKNTARNENLNSLTRELINAAIARQLDLTADAVRALCLDTSFETEYRELASDLLADTEFNEALEAGHVTYGMIKPKVNEAKPQNMARSDDEVAREVLGSIASPLEPTIVRPTYMPLTVARDFYANLKGLGESDAIFDRVAGFMSSGAMTGMVLLNETGSAITEWRTQIGATDPKKAADGTIRKRFADEMSNNVAHGSDSTENARREIGIFKQLL